MTLRYDYRMIGGIKYSKFLTVSSLILIIASS